MKKYDLGFEKIGVDVSQLKTKDYTTCPECSHKRKQANKKQKVLAINQESGHYTCNHCDFKGRVDSNDWINNKTARSDEYTPQISHSKPKVIQSIKEEIKPFKTGVLRSEGISYLNSRGISLETAKKLRVAQNKNWLAFNYYKDGKIVNAKYRGLEGKKFYQHKGCDKYLYNLENLKNQDTICIVEGEFDVLSIVEAGFLNVGSVSQGAPNAGTSVGSKLQCLDNSIEYIKNAKKVIIWTDNDPNGKYLEKILIERFGSDRCAVVDKGDWKDANECLVKNCAEYVKELIDNAKDVPIEGVRCLSQVSDKMDETYHNGYRKGVRVGMSEIDDCFSFYKGWWNLFHGIPNSGKSAFINFLMMCMSAKHGWKWAVFSPEHYPAEDFYTDMVEVLTGRTTDKDGYNRLPFEYFQIAKEFIDKHFFFVYPQGDGITNSTDNVIDKIKELKLAKDIDGYLIDPYNQLIRTDNDNISVYLERSLSQVDHLNKTHNLCGNIVAHPRTVQKAQDEEDYRKSTTYEVAGGAMWYNKSYISTCVHRPKNQSDKTDTLVEIDVQKVKSHKRAGTPATVLLNYDREKQWYVDGDGNCPLTGFFETLLPSYEQGTMDFEEQGQYLDFEGDPLPF